MIRGGKSYVSASPGFSNDGKRILVCTGNAVSIFSTSTGLQVSSLEAHQALVTSVIVVPSLAKTVSSLCWTSSLDGTIRFWDFSLPQLIKTVDIKLPIFSMVIPSLLGSPAKEKPQNVFAYVSVEDIRMQGDTQGLRGQIRKCNLTESHLVRGLILKETERPEFLITSPTGEFFGIRNKRKMHIWKAPATESPRATMKKITLHHTRNLTVVAFHPNERMVAAGDMSGRILIWRLFGKRNFAVGDELETRRAVDDEDHPGVRENDDADSCTTWHWHSAEVTVLSFSSSGAYLYSGGREGVIVAWQVDTAKRNYLPRIGSPLLYFVESPDPSLSAISCADNQIHLLNMQSMKVLNSISGIRLPFPILGEYEGSCKGIAFDCNRGLAALCTENYNIQFYSLISDRGVSEVQVYERTHQPGDETTVVVTHIALSLDGNLMSTVEVKLPEDGLGGLVSLKFWTLGPQNKEFSLSTIVYEPHRSAGISDVSFHPSRKMAVSSSHGRDFKVWVHEDIIQQKDALQNSGWICHSVGSYKKRPMTAVAFSADGSVLAVAAETVVTLWDPDRNVLVAVVGETQTPIMRLSFIGESGYLVSASQGSTPQLSVWNLSKISLSWSHKLHVEAIACAMDQSSFAVLALVPESSECMGYSNSTFHGRDGLILLFNANDPVPVATWSVWKAIGGALAFLQVHPSYLEEIGFDGKPPKALLAYINGNHEYVVFDPHSTNAHEMSGIRRDDFVANDETGLYGYTSIYGELPAFDPKKKGSSWAQPVLSEKPWESIFSGPSHCIPPLTKYVSGFLESLAKTG